MGGDGGSQPISQSPKYDAKTDNGFTFPGPDRRIMSENGDENQRGQSVDQTTITGEFVEQKTSARGGLVERMAARAGHNAPRLNTHIIKPADNTSQNQQVRSPYLTIPPGLSPTSLLDSPVFLSNSLVQPSPTTGKFEFAPNGNGNGNGRNYMMFSDSSNKSEDKFFEDVNTSFAFKPFPDLAPLSRDHVNPPFMSSQAFQSYDASLAQPGKQLQPQKVEPTQNEASSSHINSGFSIASTEKKPEVNNFSLQMTPVEALNGNLEQSQAHHDDDVDKRISGDIVNSNGASSEDGYNWRKYGQKQVKGSEYPRSYYKCTHPNCLVKKKVERSHEGHVTEIIYKGVHNHPKLAQNHRSSDMQGDVMEKGRNGVDGGSGWAMNMQPKGNTLLGQESNMEVTSSGSVMQGPNGARFESSDAADGSSTFSNEEEDDRATHGSVSLGYDGEGDESESKRRKIEAFASDVSGATRAIREPRVVVQTTSEVDILDDGYRWRKYGQKVVKGNPNPRSYYKCTSTGCTVRKHVERASHDLKSVITTYEGKHNHDVPAARNSSHSNNNMSASIQPQVHMTEQSRIQNSMARFERPPYGLHNGQQLGPIPTHGYGFAMSQQGPGHMAIANQGKMPVFPVHHYLGQPRQMNEMGLLLPKGEPKVEPMSDPGPNLANGAPVYHQMVNRLPLWPQT